MYQFEEMLRKQKAAGWRGGREEGAEASDVQRFGAGKPRDGVSRDRKRGGVGETHLGGGGDVHKRQQLQNSVTNHQVVQNAPAVVA